MHQETFIQLSAIYWALMNLAAMCLMLLLFRTQRKTPYLLFAIAAFLKACWGLTIPGVDIESVKIINSIFLPVVAGTIYFFACYTLVVEVSKAKKIKSENKE